MSKTKTVNDSKPVVLNLSAASDVPAFPKTSLVKNKWVTFGPKNLFPQDIIRFNARSPVNSSIIESTVTYICGKGVRDTAKVTGRYTGRPNSKESWDDIIEPLAKDFKTFGGFYLQIIKQKNGVTVSVFHQDFSTVRIGEIDENGAPKTFQISNDWTKTSGKNAPVEIPVWESIDKAESGQAYMFYYWRYSAGLPRYCVPDWFAALEYVKADGTLGEFYNNSLENGFAPSVVIKMPSNPDETTKETFQRDMENAFTGAKGACKIVILWGENTDIKPDIVPFNASANADIYNNIEGIIFQKIISAHRLASPTLAGVSGSGNLSGNAAEIIDAYVLYNYTVVEKMRKTILDKLNIFTAINGLAELEIEELDVLPKIRETEGEDAAQPAALSSNRSKFRKFLNKLGLWK